MRLLLPPATLLLAALLPAQQVLVPAAAAHGSITATKDGLVLPAGEFTVVELIEATAAFLCRNYLYDQGDVSRRGGFALQRAIALDAPGSEELLCALLATRNLAALPLDELRGVYQVVALDADPRLLAVLPWRTPEEILRRPRLRDPVVTAFEVRHVDARQLAQAFRQHALQQPGSPPPLFTAFAADEHLLLLRGYRDQLAQAIQLVQQLEHAHVPTVGAHSPLQRRVEELEREVAELKRLLLPADGPR